jgi:hypothetical protein
MTEAALGHRDLQGQMPDPACARVIEHPLAFLEVRGVDQVCQAVRAASGTAAAGTASRLAGNSSGRPRPAAGSSRPGHLLLVLGQIIADLVFQVPLQRTSLAETPGGDHRCGIACLCHVGRASRREQSAQIQLILRSALAG